MTRFAALALQTVAHWSLLVLFVAAGAFVGGCDSSDALDDDPPTGGLTIHDGLIVTAIGKSYTVDPAIAPIAQMQANMGGNTSVRNNDPEHLVWKDEGYFQRNRDLGQVFTPLEDFTLDAIVLRTGPGDKAVLSGTPGSEVFLEFFEVTGTPYIDDNDTPPGTDATHGFTKNHRADDYILGIEYEPYLVLTGGIFPDIPPTHDGTREVNGRAGNLYYMRWKPTEAIEFEKGKLYAFMVGLQEPGPGYGFTLANDNRASSPAPPRLDDPNDLYTGGWALRREGNGEPPNTVPGQDPPVQGAVRESLVRESMFGEGEDRYLLAPTTNGFPDVDTYRDLQFVIEVRGDA